MSELITSGVLPGRPLMMHFSAPGAHTSLLPEPSPGWFAKDCSGRWLFFCSVFGKMDAEQG
jgi:hypothetical protein